jgi:hypothetical protein
MNYLGVGGFGSESGFYAQEQRYTLNRFKDLPRILDYFPLLAFKNGITI